MTGSVRTILTWCDMNVILLFLLTFNKDDYGAAKRLKMGGSSNTEQHDSTPGRTDDLTSHSSDEADIDSTVSSKSKARVFNAPKRPKTAYMIFLENSKAPFFDKNPNATFNEYQKYAGQLWRSFSQEEKMVCNYLF